VAVLCFVFQTSVTNCHWNSGRCYCTVSAVITINKFSALNDCTLFLAYHISTVSVPQQTAVFILSLQKSDDVSC
jgi:hypothetical protein